MSEKARVEDKSEMEIQRLLLMPPAEEQRAIICSLESDTAEESIYVYTVSQAWYDRWRAYVGLDHQVRQRADVRFNVLTFFYCLSNPCTGYMVLDRQ